MDHPNPDKTITINNGQVDKPKEAYTHICDDMFSSTQYSLKIWCSILFGVSLQLSNLMAKWHNMLNRSTKNQ